MKRRILRLVSLFVLLALLPAAGETPSGGGMHPAWQLRFVRDRVKQGVEPYASAYRQLTDSADRALRDSCHAVADFAVPGYYVDAAAHKRNSLSLQTDAFRAYACALAYALGRERRYADHAVRLLDGWASVNRRYSEPDGPLVMCYSGTALVMAAELLRDYRGWSPQARERFGGWIREVYRKACRQIRGNGNNWGDWGRFGSALCAAYLDDGDELAETVRLIRSDLFRKIAPDGHMPAETARGANGIWYTYFSLSPLTAACWVVYTQTGENLFTLERDGCSLKNALDYLLYHNERPDEWTWFPNPVQGRPGGSLSGGGCWPANLIEAMGGLYGDRAFTAYAASYRPLCYGVHHFSWVFPTLMPVRFYR